MSKLPYITVNGKPFLSLGGQTHNSSSYHLEKMAPSWNSIHALHGNTMATPIPWDAWEPEEGKYNTEFVTNLIDEARDQGLKLSLLWFATWKNGSMQYAPAWVKRDTERFPRCLLKDGTPIHQLSAFSKENQQADERAFVALVKLLKEYDEEERTVIAVQIENEVGIQGGTRRDFGEAAEKAYRSLVPRLLISYCKENPDCYLAEVWQKNGAKEGANWADTFGYYGAEGVMAYQIANYVDEICAAAKKVYPDLFMYINAWLDGGSRGTRFNLAGIDWPAGCPTIHNLDIYHAVVENLDTIAPDNYQSGLSRYKEVTKAYSRPDIGFPLYVPESGAGVNVGQMFEAIANYGAIGYHVFGAESYLAEDGVNVSERMAPIMHNFAMLDNVKSILWDYREKGRVWAAVQEEDEASILLEGFEGGYVCPVVFGQYAGDWVSSDFRHRKQMMAAMTSNAPKEVGRALIFQESEKVFYAVGHNSRLQFNKYPIDGSIPATYAATTLAQVNFDTISVTEGHFDEEGNYIVDLTRSGDESRHGTWLQWDCGVVRIELV